MISGRTAILTENAGFYSFSGNGVSAPRYGRLENLRVVAIVVAELEFRDVQRQIFAADLVVGTHDAALNQRPEAVNGLSVHHAVNIAAYGVPHENVFELVFQVPVSSVFVAHDQADLLRNGLPHEAIQSVGVGVFDERGQRRCPCG